MEEEVGVILVQESANLYKAIKFQSENHLSHISVMFY